MPDIRTTLSSLSEKFRERVEGAFTGIKAAVKGQQNSPHLIMNINNIFDVVKNGGIDALEDHHFDTIIDTLEFDARFGKIDLKNKYLFNWGALDIYELVDFVREPGDEDRRTRALMKLCHIMEVSGKRKPTVTRQELLAKEEAAAKAKGEQPNPDDQVA